LPSNGTVEHPTECDTIDRSRMNAETNNPARILIHDDQDPMGPQCCRLAPEKIHAPEAVFHVFEGLRPAKPYESRVCNCFVFSTEIATFDSVL
jgi:hypothetical protein